MNHTVIDIHDYDYITIKEWLRMLATYKADLEKYKKKNPFAFSLVKKSAR